MESKFNFAVLSFLGLFFVAAGLTIQLGDSDKYVKCWEAANCGPDGPLGDGLSTCINFLKPEELKDFYKFVQDNYYKFKSKDFVGSIKEFCGLDDAAKKSAFHQSLNSTLAYQKQACGDPDKAGTCDRLGEDIGCIFLKLDSLKKQQKC